MKILIIGHGHAAIRMGGAERAAYTMFEKYKAMDGVEPFLLATVPLEEVGHMGAYGLFAGRQDEVILCPPPVDGFRLSTSDHALLEMRLKELLDIVKPDIVHMHHYVSLGVESVEIIKRLTGAKLFITLHEYIPICYASGIMLKEGTKKLCNRSSFAECSSCFPKDSAGRFFLRKRYIDHYFDMVDGFFSPSEFLRQRYIAWGLDANRIDHIENFLPDYDMPEESLANLVPVKAENKKLRLGYFGQLNQFKGADVLLNSLMELDDDLKHKIELIIFGVHLEEQPEEFQQTIKSLMAEGSLRTSFLGAYKNEDVIALMQGVDFVVVPSIWWENSPLVIQEAKAAGTPLIVSNIGGMKEKVRHGIDGFHFQVGSTFHLSALLTSIVTNKWQRVEKLDVQAQNKTALDQTFDWYNRSYKSYGQ